MCTCLYVFSLILSVEGLISVQNHGVFYQPIWLAVAISPLSTYLSVWLAVSIYPCFLPTNLCYVLSPNIPDFYLPTCVTCSLHISMLSTYLSVLLAVYIYPCFLPTYLCDLLSSNIPAFYLQICVTCCLNIFLFSTYLSVWFALSKYPCFLPTYLSDLLSIYGTFHNWWLKKLPADINISKWYYFFGFSIF